MAIQQVKETTNHAHSPRRQTLDRYMNNAGRFVSNFLINHWATMITWMLGILVFAALSVPFLSYFGLDAISKQIFFALHMVCAQIPSHSFYIFGHQLGMCARNFSIYASMFIGSLIFVLSNKRIPGIPWWVWILMILPMALDGTTQDRKSTRLNSSHGYISHAVFCLQKKTTRLNSSHGYISYAVFCLKKKTQQVSYNGVHRASNSG